MFKRFKKLAKAKILTNKRIFILWIMRNVRIKKN